MEWGRGYIAQGRDYPACTSELFSLILFPTPENKIKIKTNVKSGVCSSGSQMTPSLAARLSGIYFLSLYFHFLIRWGHSRSRQQNEQVL